MGCFSVPLKLVIALMLIIVATITGFSVFVPTYKRGVSSTRQVLDLALDATVATAVSRVEAFFSYPQRVLSALETAQQEGVLMLGLDEPPSPGSSGRSRFFCALLRNDPLGRITTAAIFLPNIRYFEMCVRASVITYQNLINETLRVFFEVPPLGFVHDPTDSLFTKSLSFDLVLQYPLYSRIVSGYNNNRRWVDAVLPGLFQPQLSAGFPFMYGGQLAVFSFDITSNATSSIMRSLGLSGDYRALILHRPSRIVIGISWDERVFDYYGLNNMTVYNVSGFKDKILSSVIAHLGGAEAFYRKPLPFKKKFGRNEEDIKYIVMNNVSDAHGLDLMITVILFERDYLGNFYKTRNNVLISVVTSVCILLIISVALVMVLLRPLMRLGERMERTSRLQDCDVEDAQSTLTEIRFLQLSYWRMKEQLDVMKKYLPQSVLANMVARANTTDTEGEDADEGDPLIAEESCMNSSFNPNASFNRRCSFSNLNVNQTVNSGSNGPNNRSAKESYILSSGYEDSLAIPTPVLTPLAGPGNNNTTTRREKKMRQVELNMAAVLKNRRVCYLAMNVTGWHELIKVAGGGDSLSGHSTLLSRYLTVITRRINEVKGVIDMFQGDHIYASFNAVQPVVASPRRAVTVALEAHRELLQPEGHLPGMSMVAGIAMGNAVVGNSGSNDMLKFNIVGNVVSEAISLAQFTRCLRAGYDTFGDAGVNAWRPDFSESPSGSLGAHTQYLAVPVCVSGAIMNETEADFCYQIVDLIALPDRASNQRNNSLMHLEHSLHSQGSHASGDQRAVPLLLAGDYPTQIASSSITNNGIFINSRASYRRESHCAMPANERGSAHTSPGASLSAHPNAQVHGSSIQAANGQVNLTASITGPAGQSTTSAFNLGYNESINSNVNLFSTSASPTAATGGGLPALQKDNSVAPRSREENSNHAASCNSNKSASSSLNLPSSPTVLNNANTENNNNDKTEAGQARDDDWSKAIYSPPSCPPEVDLPGDVHKDPLGAVLSGKGNSVVPATKSASAKVRSPTGEGEAGPKVTPTRASAAITTPGPPALIPPAVKTPLSSAVLIDPRPVALTASRRRGVVACAQRYLSKMGGDEWMYELANANQRDPYRNANDGFFQLLQGMSPAFIMRGLSEESPDIPGSPSAVGEVNPIASPPLRAGLGRPPPPCAAPIGRARLLRILSACRNDTDAALYARRVVL